MSKPPVGTSIATSDAEDIYIRDVSLCKDLIGKVTFSEMIYFQMLGRRPTEGQRDILDACLVTLMEHGLTPSAISTRLIYSSAPEAMQGAVAAGLLGVGSVFVGTMDGCAALLDRIMAASDRDSECEAIVREFREPKRPIPGFGHPIHKPDDPRTLALFELARARGVAGDAVDALTRLGTAIDSVAGKHITINATGAVAAVLMDCAMPASILRGVALISRCAGLVGHIYEEQLRPSMTTLWHASEAAVPYDGSAGS